MTTFHVGNFNFKGGGGGVNVTQWEVSAPSPPLPQTHIHTTPQICPPADIQESRITSYVMSI